MRQFTSDSRLNASSSADLGRPGHLQRLSRAVSGIARRLVGEAAEKRPAMTESLEQRRLLTTLFGGESITYSSFDFETLPEGPEDFFNVVLTVEGNSSTQVELYGSTLDGQLADLSGFIQSPDEERTGPTRGGLGGVIGSVTLVPDNADFIAEGGAIQQFNLTDFVGFPFPTVTPGVLLAPQDLIQFNAMATNSAGRTIGAQLVDVPVGDVTIRTLQLVEFNTDLGDYVPDAGSPSNQDLRTPGAGSLGDQTNVGDALFLNDVLAGVINAFTAAGDPISGDDAEAIADNVVSLFGASFSPSDPNTLYLGLNVVVSRNTSFPPAPDDPQDTEISAIVAVDINSFAVEVVATDFFADDQRLDAEVVGTVNAFAAVGGSGSNPDLVVHGTFRERLGESTGNQRIVEQTGLLYVPNANITQQVDLDDVSPVVSFGETPVIQTLTFRPGVNGGVYGLTEAGEEAALLKFTENFGTFHDIGTQINGAVIEAEYIGGVRRSADEGDATGESLLSLTWNPVVENRFTGENGTFLSFDTETDQVVAIDQRPRGVGGALSLYNIVVTGGDASTRITVYALDDDGNPIGFEGGSAGLARGGDNIIESPGGSGPLYMGMKYVTEDPEFVVTYGSLSPTEVTEGTTPFFGPTYGGQIRPGFYSMDGSIGAFFWGGTVTGNVRVEGSLGQFYAGLIATGDAGETGDYNIDNFAVFGDVGTIVSATSIGNEEDETDAPDVSEYFAPDGDYSGYSSGVDFAIGGRVSSIRAGSMIAATFDIRGDRPGVDFDPDATFFEQLAGIVNEIEYQADSDNAGNALASGTPTVSSLYNDTFDTYEPIGLYEGRATVRGLISGNQTQADIDDSVDYYGLSLLAGQEIILHLRAPGGGSATSSLQIGIFDPDGRLVTTDYEDNPRAVSQIRNRPFVLRAETAGVYRIAVATTPDADFNEAGGEFASQLYTTEAYEIFIDQAGDMALGGIKANNLIWADDLASNIGAGNIIQVHQGDVGVVESRTGTLFGAGAVRTLAGHIRQISGSSVGFYDSDPQSIGHVNARAAYSLGALRASGLGGDNYGGDIFFNWTGVLDADNLPLASEVIGDDIMVVKAARDIFGNFIAGRGIGSIVAGRDWGSDTGAPEGRFGSGFIIANSDGLGNDGFVDMFSVGGNIGIGSESGAISGGPGIDVGTGGNFRYMDVPAGGLVSRDPFFGNDTGEPLQNLEPGLSYSFTDDSGTRVVVVPADEETRINSNTGNMEVVRPAGQLSVLNYPIRSGGTVLATVVSDRSVTIRTLDRGPRSTAEIGNVRISGEGRPVINASNGFNQESRLVLEGTDFDPSDPLGQDDAFDDLTVDVSGSHIDLFSIDGIGTGDNAGKFTRISNPTGGEIVDVTASSIGEISADRIGVPLTRGLAKLDAAQTRTNVYPFNNQPYLIGVEGDVIDIRGEILGNIWVGLDQGFGNTGAGGGGGGGGDPGGGDTGGGTGGGGTGGGTGGAGNGSGGGGAGNGTGQGVVGGAGDGIGGTSNGGLGGVGGIGVPIIGAGRGRIANIIANPDGRFDQPYYLEGIAGPIVAATPDTDEVQGEIQFINIGEGIADDGRGNMSTGGVYAEGYIGQLVGNDGANIYGDVVALELGTLTLNGGGSLIGADILQNPTRSAAGAGDFSATREFDAQRGAIPAYLEVNELADQSVYEFDRIIINGPGGIIGSTIGAADVDRIEVNGGFGIFTSVLDSGVEGVQNYIGTDGFGIRNVDIGTGRDVNTVEARGDASLLNIESYSNAVDLSGGGNLYDPNSGDLLGAGNDLRRALGMPIDVNSRRRITNSGVIENTTVTGSRDLGSLTGSVLRSNLETLVPEPGFEDTSEGMGQGNPESENLLARIDFGRTVSHVGAISSYGFRVTAGELRNYALSDDMLNTNLRISGEIVNVSVADTIRGDSIIRADGPEGILTRVEAENIYGLLSGDVGIGTIVARNNLGGPSADPAVATVTPASVRSLGPIDSITVGNDILTGAYIRATDAIGTLTVGRDIQAGAVVQANSIDDLDVAGNIFGDIIVVI